MKYKPSDVKYFIKAFAEANAQVPILLIGDMGIGKSQIVHQVANELGFRMFDFRAATQDPGDLTGMPRTISEKAKDGKDVYKTIWADLAWIPPADSKFMLFMDEVNRGPLDVRQAIFQIMTEYRAHMQQLPKHTQIVLAINPVDTIYQVEDLDAAFNNRVFTMEMIPDADEWMQYMYSIDGDKRVIQFINVHNDLLCKPTDKGPCPTPRSLDMLSRALKVIGGDDNRLFQAAASLCGSEFAATFRKFCDKAYKKPVTGAEILADYHKVKARLEEQKEDANANTIQDLIALLNSENAPKIKYGDKSFTNLVDYLLTHKNHADFKMKLVNNLPRALLNVLSNDAKLIDYIASVQNAANKALQQ